MKSGHHTVIYSPHFFNENNSSQFLKKNRNEIELFLSLVCIGGRSKKHPVYSMQYPETSTQHPANQEQPPRKPATRSPD